VGDYLFARAANLVAETDHVRVMDEFAKTLMIIINGEVEQRFTRWDADREAYARRIHAKTGALFVLAAQAAALLGGAPEAYRLALVEYGRAIGTAFQIVDDVLDYTADAAHLGKPAGGDLRQGILTLPLIHYLEAHPDDPDLRLLLSVKNGEHPAVDAVVEKVRRSPSTLSALEEARGYVEQARAALEPLPQSIYTQALSDLALTVVDRAI
jgi:geranylgeranyl pyrophosphate synthase